MVKKFLKMLKHDEATQMLEENKEIYDVLNIE